MGVLKTLFKIMVPFVIITAGGMAAYYMYLNRPAPEMDEVLEPEIPVQVYTTKRADFEITVDGNGEVMPALQIVLQPQINGKIVETDPDLIPGGIFQEGETLLKIDPRDYQYTVEQLNDRVEQTKMMLEEEQGRQTVASREWKLLGNEVETTEQGKSLALREPHIRSAQASVNAAISMLEDAKLDLERTTLHAPFNCWVMNENVDIGQVVNPQTQIAALVGTDRYWVDAKISTADLPYIFIPGINSETGSKVTIVHNAEPLHIEYKGKIIRLLGDMSTSGRQVRVLVEVEDPLGLNREQNSENYPLFLGTFVNVHIQGKKVEHVFSVPRVALREGNRVWVRNQEGRLEIHEVTILKKRKDDVLVTAGLEEGQQIVTSLLATPLPGIKLIIEELENTDLGNVEVPEKVVRTN